MSKQIGIMHILLFVDFMNKWTENAKIGLEEINTWQIGSLK